VAYWLEYPLDSCIQPYCWEVRLAALYVPHLCQIADVQLDLVEEAEQVARAGRLQQTVA
jgi:hypothetical protein